MSAVTLVIGGRPVTVSCGDGEEERMRRLGAELSKTIGLLREQPLATQADERDIVILAALSVLERRDRAEERIAALNLRNREVETGRAMVAAEAREARDAVAERIVGVAAELEGLAAMLTAALAKKAQRVQHDSDSPLEG